MHANTIFNSSGDVPFYLTNLRITDNLDAQYLSVLFNETAQGYNLFSALGTNALQACLSIVSDVRAVSVRVYQYDSGNATSTGNEGEGYGVRGGDERASWYMIEELRDAVTE